MLNGVFERLAKMTTGYTNSHTEPKSSKNVQKDLKNFENVQNLKCPKKSANVKTLFPAAAATAHSAAAALRRRVRRQISILHLGVLLDLLTEILQVVHVDCPLPEWPRFQMF